tara:strand:- start:1548 stop:1880 length:333 start_codon:yes stop_codon:yes gene_type:complete
MLIKSIAYMSIRYMDKYIYNMKDTNNTRDLIIETSTEVMNLLLEKNAAYGDSALNPVGIFSRGNAVDSLCARIDDKLMRIKSKGITDATEDTVQDLIGYLILLKIATNQQ